MKIHAAENNPQTLVEQIVTRAATASALWGLISGNLAFAIGFTPQGALTVGAFGAVVGTFHGLTAAFPEAIKILNPGKEEQSEEVGSRPNTPERKDDEPHKKLIFEKLLDQKFTPLRKQEWELFFQEKLRSESFCSLGEELMRFEFEEAIELVSRFIPADLQSAFLRSEKEDQQTLFQILEFLLAQESQEVIRDHLRSAMSSGYTDTFVNVILGSILRP